MCDEILTNKRSGKRATRQSNNQSNNQTIKQSNNLTLTLTLKAWPVIAGATIGLCFLTQQVAKLFGIELPDQQNIEVVKKLAGLNWRFAFLCLQVLIVMPALEELVFRGLLFKLPCRFGAGAEKTRATGGAGETRGRLLSLTSLGSLLSLGSKLSLLLAFASSALFSAAHYLAQPWPDAAFLALFLFGLAQCWLYRKTDRIWCPMLNHALFNLTNLVLLFVLPGE